MPWAAAQARPWLGWGSRNVAMRSGSQTSAPVPPYRPVVSPDTGTAGAGAIVAGLPASLPPVDVPTDVFAGAGCDVPPAVGEGEAGGGDFGDGVKGSSPSDVEGSVLICMASTELSKLTPTATAPMARASRPTSTTRAPRPRTRRRLRGGPSTAPREAAVAAAATWEIGAETVTGASCEPTERPSSAVAAAAARSPALPWRVSGSLAMPRATTPSSPAGRSGTISDG